MTLAADVDLEEFVMSKDDLSGADIKVKKLLHLVSGALSWLTRFWCRLSALKLVCWHCVNAEWKWLQRISVKHERRCCIEKAKAHLKAYIFKSLSFDVIPAQNIILSSILLLQHLFIESLYVGFFSYLIATWVQTNSDWRGMVCTSDNKKNALRVEEKERYKRRAQLTTFLESSSPFFCFLFLHAWPFFFLAATHASSTVGHRMLVLPWDV